MASDGKDEPAGLGERLRAGDMLKGTCILSPSPSWPEAVKATGVDVVFLDTEHVALDRHQLSWMCRTYNALGMPPIVRVPEPEPFRICCALDGGAKGIVAPYIETRKQVRDLIGAVKLRPLKGARLDEALDALEEGKDLAAVLGDDLAAFIAKKSRGLALLINIESAAAIANLDNLTRWPSGYLDALLIGPADLAANLGIPAQWTNPKFLEAIETIIKHAKSSGLGSGCHYSFVKAKEYQAAWFKLGANLIMHSTDLRSFTDAITADFREIEARIAGEAGAGKPAGGLDDDVGHV